MAAGLPSVGGAADILDALARIKDDLPKKQCQLCNFLLYNYQTAGMATVSELAERAGVGTTTVLRLVAALGYDTFNAFKKDLLSVIILRENPPHRDARQNFGKEDALSIICDEAILSIRNMVTPRNIEQCKRTVELLMGAKRINILAQRTSKAAALYLEFSLAPFLPDNIRQLSMDQDYAFDKVLTMEEGDVVFIISNWPCGTHTIAVADACRDRRIPMILLTNTGANPMARYCDILLDTNSIGSPCLLLPAIAVLEAITFELGRRMAPESTQKLEKLEEMLRSKRLLVW